MTEERFNHLSNETRKEFVILRKILELMPIPIRIDSLDTARTDEEARATLAYLNKSRGILLDEPISANLRDSIHTLILEWFTIYELMSAAATTDVSPPWRYDAVELCQRRFGNIASRIEASPEFKNFTQQ